MFKTNLYMYTRSLLCIKKIWQIMYNESNYPAFKKHKMSITYDEQNNNIKHCKQ